MPTASRIDWEPSDMELCEKLGERLSKGGYVTFRKVSKEWIVCTPGQAQVHQTVTVNQQFEHPVTPYELLDCTCQVARFNNGVCVHKAAVEHHAQQPCEYSWYLRRA